MGGSLIHRGLLRWGWEHVPKTKPAQRTAVLSNEDKGRVLMTLVEALDLAMSEASSTLELSSSISQVIPLLSEPV